MMITNSGRRFARTNDYRVGERFPARPRTKENIRVVRPAEEETELTVTHTNPSGAERETRRDFFSAA